MQTTTISVVSNIEDIQFLEGIRAYIEDECEGYVVVDMTTNIETRDGDYTGSIVSQEAAILMTKDPLLPFIPAPLAEFFHTLSFNIISVLLLVFGVPLQFVSLWLSGDYQIATFVVGCSLQILMYIANISIYKSKLLKKVASGFEFWYLLAVQTVAQAAGGYLFVSANLPISAVAILLGCFHFSQALFIYGIDASPYSRRARLVLVSFFALSYLTVYFVARFIQYLVAEAIYEDFIGTRLDFYLFTISPQEALMSSTLTLILFFAKYAGCMVWGDEFVLLWFEAKNSDQEFGAIESQTVLVRTSSIFCQSRVSLKEGDGVSSGAIGRGSRILVSSFRPSESADQPTPSAVPTRENSLVFPVAGPQLVSCSEDLSQSTGGGVGSGEGKARVEANDQRNPLLKDISPTGDPLNPPRLSTEHLQTEASPGDGRPLSSSSSRPTSSARPRSVQQTRSFTNDLIIESFSAFEEL
jgi:hypothetical protein